MQILDSKERQVFSMLEYSPEAKKEDVARALRLKTSTVQSIARKLVDSGSIKKHAILNPFALGLFPVAIYTSLAGIGDAAEEKLIQSISNHPRVTYYEELAGDYHLVVIFLVKNIAEIPLVISDFFGELEDLFMNKVISPRYSYLRLQRAYISTLKKRVVVKLGPIELPIKLDSLDVQILYQSVTIGYESLRQLATKLSEPYTTIERRFNRLKESKVIPCSYYRTTNEPLGTLYYSVMITTKGFSREISKKIERFVSKHPWTIYLMETMGLWDFEIGIEVEKPEYVRLFIQNLNGEFSSSFSEVKIIAAGKVVTSRRFPFQTWTDYQKVYY